MSTNQDLYKPDYVPQDAHTHLLIGLCTAIPLGLLIWYGLLRLAIFIYCLLA